MFCVALAAALASVALVAAPAQAATVTISGVIRDSAGTPVANLPVTLVISGASSNRSDTTDDGGAYEIAADEGSVVMVQFRPVEVNGGYLVESSTFVLQGNRVENLTLPARSMVTTSVVEGDDGTASADALVTLAGARAPITGSGGLAFLASDFPHCGTDAAGSCTLRAFRGGYVEQLWVSGKGRYAEVFPGLATPDASRSGTVVLAPAPKISGVLRDASGAGIQGATVTLVGAPRIYPTTTGSDGRWSVRSAPGGPYRIQVDGYLKDIAERYEFETAAFQHDAARTVDLTIPAIEQLGVNVRSSNGNPVPGAYVRAVGTSSSESGETDDGLAFDVYLNRDGVTSTSDCRTEADGRCTLPVFSRGSTPRLSVVPAGATAAQEFPGTPYVPSEPREVSPRLIGYASATSLGSPGTVLATSDADLPVFAIVPDDLEDGLSPVVGRVEYEVALPAGQSRTTFELRLPGGAADSLFRRSADSGLDLVGRRSGIDTFSVTVVDGSAGDADGAVNGSVTGNVIPARMAALQITTGQLPAAGEGKPYSARLEGSGPGGPLTWSVDPDYPLPVGMTLASDGTVSGTAPARGYYSFRAVLRDSRGWQPSVGRFVGFYVDKVAVLTSTLPGAYVGGTYSTKLEHSGGGFPSWSLDGGSLPPGLRLASTGTISGRPTAVGTFGFWAAVRVSGTTSQPRYLTITVDPMEISTDLLPDGTVGRWYSQQLTTNGGKGTLTWSLVSGSLPPKLKLGSGGRITGTPSARGTWTFTVRVTDSSVPMQEAVRTLSITVT
jgi:hypothetical protein